MKIRELYEDSIKYNAPWLTLVIELIVFEKKALSLDDDESKISYFLQDRFKDSMTYHLEELNKKLKLVKKEKEKWVYEINHKNKCFYVMAYNEKQAKSFFINKVGEIESMRMESPDTEIVVNGITTTFRRLMKKPAPVILGYFEYYSIRGSENDEERGFKKDR